MRRVLLVLAILVAVGLGGWWGYDQYLVASRSTRDAAATAAAGQAQVAGPDEVIWASGRLVPVRWAGLSPAAGGTVRGVHVNEGDQVEAGTLLVELDSGVLQSQVEVAAAAVAEAEAARNKLLASVAPSQLAAARAELAAAQAGIALAQASLKQAQAAVAAAEAQVAIAQAQYNELASRPTPAEKVAAQSQVEMAQVAVKNAQAAYDTVRGDPHIAARPEALALEQATTALRAAQAAYAVATQGATREQLAVARAQINAAEVQVEVASAQIPAAEANVRAAEARAASAQAALDGLLAGATAEDKAMAEAGVQSAQAALAAARAQLAQTQVYAPFAGQIGTVYTRPGELVMPGQPVLMLGDTNQMRVETTDLRETDVTRLKTGMAVEVTFDALPGRAFRGVVTHIAAMSTTEKGSTNYTAVIEVADLDPSLRWGMTAFVNVRVDQ